MSKKTWYCGIMLLLLMIQSQSVYAVDSYRWLTVSINTPWMIFVFLLPLVLVPLILMAVMYWRFAKPADDKEEGKDQRQFRGNRRLRRR
jgi:heme/copper-type cytochrome/quinol oxidase subunit 2